MDLKMKKNGGFDTALRHAQGPLNHRQKEVL